MQTFLTGLTGAGKQFKFQNPNYRQRENIVCGLPTQTIYALTSGFSNPGQPQSTTIKVSVGKEVGQTVAIVILVRVEIQQVAGINVGAAKGVCLALARTAVTFLANLQGAQALATQSIHSRV